MRPTAVRAVPALLAVLLVCTAIGAAVSASSAQRSGEVDGPTTTMDLTIRENGDARWVVTMRFDTSTPERRDGFERIASAFRNGSSVYLSIETFERGARLASRATGREMSITGIDRATHTGEVSRLVLSFTWRGFAATPGDRITVGDAFRKPNGTWFPRLTERQVLRISFPSGYGPENVVWPIRNGSVYVAGPVEFSPGEPSAVFARSTFTPRTPTPHTPTVTPTPHTPTATPTPTDVVGPETPSGDVPVAGLLVGLIIVGLLAYVIWDRGDRLPFGDDSPGTNGGATGTNDGGAAETNGAVDEGGPSPTANADGEETGKEPLLSDEERVLRLLRANGGRMKQARIVEETDWSNAKVSQLLSKMDERGEIEKLRLGRENLISLPGEAPDGVE